MGWQQFWSKAMFRTCLRPGLCLCHGTVPNCPIALQAPRLFTGLECAVSISFPLVGFEAGRKSRFSKCDLRRNNQREQPAFLPKRPIAAEDKSRDGAFQRRRGGAIRDAIIGRRHWSGGRLLRGEPDLEVLACVRAIRVCTARAIFMILIESVSLGHHLSAHFRHRRSTVGIF